jgi:hypothetical protein
MIFERDLCLWSLGCCANAPTIQSSAQPDIGPSLADQPNIEADAATQGLPFIKGPRRGLGRSRPRRREAFFSIGQAVAQGTLKAD